MQSTTRDHETNLVNSEVHIAQEHDGEEFIFPGVFRNCGSKSAARSYLNVPPPVSLISSPGATLQPSDGLSSRAVPPASSCQAGIQDTARQSLPQDRKTPHAHHRQSDSPLTMFRHDHPHDPEPRSDLNPNTWRCSYGIPTPAQSELSSVPATPAIAPQAQGIPQEICFGDPVLSLIRPPDRIIVLDRYPISSGGSCNIYRGSFHLAGRELLVAIKLIRTSNGDEIDRVLKKLHREEGLWKTIRHPNILPFFGLHAIEASEIPALVSPFCKFGQIREYLLVHPQANRNMLVHGVADGLAFLHSRGIVHGDIKPENIVVDKKGNPCICDFGISRIMDCSGFTTRTVGTLAYMALELFTVVDGRTWIEPSRTTKDSDVYSFALMALEILAAEELKDRPKSPFLPVEDLELHRPKLDHYNMSHIPGALKTLLQRCWHLDPQQRPSMIEVLAQTHSPGDL